MRERFLWFGWPRTEGYQQLPWDKERLGSDLHLAVLDSHAEDGGVHIDWTWTLEHQFVIDFTPYKHGFCLMLVIGPLDVHINVVSPGVAVALYWDKYGFQKYFPRHRKSVRIYPKD